MEKQGYVLQEETSNSIIANLGTSLQKWKRQARGKRPQHVTPFKAPGNTPKRKLLKGEAAREGAEKRRKNGEGMGQKEGDGNSLAETVAQPHQSQ